jgi:cyclopropane-fatty-acyl-phospholipid synthase
MWEFYLSISEMAFREEDLMVFQIQLSKRRDTVPLIRDYITQWESGYPEKVTLTG